MSDMHDDSKGLGKIFIGGLSWDSTNDGLRDYFSKYGEISDAVIMRDKITGRSRGFGFVCFSDPRSIDEVLKEDHVVDGRTVEIKRAIPKDEIHGRGGDDGHTKSTKKIFVGGLAHSCTDAEFRKYFEQFGAIADSQIMMERDTGRHRGFGFITFEDESSVDKVFDSSSHEVSGKQVEIKRAEPKRPAQSFPTSRGFDRMGGMGFGGFGGFGGMGGFGGFGGGYGGRHGGGGGYGSSYGGPGSGFGGYGGFERGGSGGRFGGPGYAGMGAGMGAYGGAWDGPMSGYGGMGGYGAGYGGYGSYYGGGGGGAGGRAAGGRADRAYHPYKAQF